MCSEVRFGRQEGVGAIAASGMHGVGPTGDWGAGHAQERTSHMRSMSVTLDVSKLSGWLNATACCRVERRGRSMRRKVRLGRRAGVGRRWRKRHVHEEGPTQSLEPRARAERTRNM